MQTGGVLLVVNILHALGVLLGFRIYRVWGLGLREYS